MECYKKQKKTKIGSVISTKCNKTGVVSVLNKVKHPLYKKIVLKRTKIMFHDEKNETNIGDTVKIMECRPLSKRKRWRLVNILNK